MSDIDWSVVEAAVQRGIHDYAGAYWIPANNLHGLDPQVREQMATKWAELSAPYVTDCIREDLRKAGEQP